MGGSGIITVGTVSQMFGGSGSLLTGRFSLDGEVSLLPIFHPRFAKGYGGQEGWKKRRASVPLAFQGLEERRRGVLTAFQGLEKNQVKIIDSRIIFQCLEDVHHGRHRTHGKVPEVGKCEAGDLPSEAFGKGWVPACLPMPGWKGVSPIFLERCHGKVSVLSFYPWKGVSPGKVSVLSFYPLLQIKQLPVNGVFYFANK